jgi:hypothetical protein
MKEYGDEEYYPEVINEEDMGPGDMVMAGGSID